MSKIQLTQKTEREHKEYDPITLSENVTMSVTRDQDAGLITVEMEITKEDAKPSRIMFSERQGRMFWNLNTDGMSRNTVREIVEVASQLILDLVPEIQTAE